VSDLLARLGIDPRRVAVEYTLAILKRDRYATTTIDEGDQVEIVNFVGGGCPLVGSPASARSVIPAAGRSL
jgi:thiamine biosynthesis protein ThiS